MKHGANFQAPRALARRRPSLLALEPRVLFDGAGAVVASTPVEPPAPPPAEAPTPPAAELPTPPPADTAASLPPTVEAPATPPAETAPTLPPPVVTEAGGVNNTSGGIPTVSGDAKVSKASDTQGVVTPVVNATATDSSAGTYVVSANGQWTYTVNNDAGIVQKLNVGDTLTDHFNVTASDGTKQDVSVVIRGANDAAVIAGKDTAVVKATSLKSSALLTTRAASAVSAPVVTGVLTSVDVDNAPDSFCAIVNAETSASGLGSFTVTAGGLWTYAVNTQNTTIESMDPDEVLVDSFSVHSIDGTEKVITITIQSAAESATPPASQVLFVDTQSNYLPVLSAGAAQITEVVWVNQATDGLAAVSAYVAEHQNIQSIVIVGSDAANGMSLGSATLNPVATEEQQATFSAWATQWSSSITLQVVSTSGDDMVATAGAISSLSGLQVTVVDPTVSGAALWQLSDLTNSEARDSTPDFVFVDSRVGSLAQAAQVAPQTAELIVLNPERAGLEQITAAMQHATSLDGMQIVAGQLSGQLTLGSSVVSAAELLADTLGWAQVSHHVATDGHVDVYGASTTQASEPGAVQKLAVFSGAEGLLEARTLSAIDPSLNQGYRDIVFVDANVADWQTIVAAAHTGVGVVLLTGQGDGLREMADFLGGQRALDSISVVSHGNQAALYLGSIDLTTATVNNYANDFAQIATALKPTGDLLLYGCDVGQGVAGQEFLAQVSAATGGVNVVASSNVTGALSSGGDWVLEASTLHQVTRSIFDAVALAQYSVELGGSYSVTTGTNVDTSGSIEGLVGANHPITFANLNISAAATSALLVIKAYDVDYGLKRENGTFYSIGDKHSEWDGVYIQKIGASGWQFVGYLTGVNNAWSSTTLDVTTYVKAQGAGNYSIRVIPDDNGSQSQLSNGGRFAVGVTSAQMLIDGGSGLNTVTSVAETNASVSASVTVATTATYTVEYNLLDSSGRDIASLTRTLPIVASVSTAVAGTLTLNSGIFNNGATWSSVPSGAYTLQVTLLDSSGALQSSASLPYNVVAAANVPVSGVTALITGLDAASYTGVSVADVLHTATSDTSPKITGQLSNIASATAIQYVDVYADGQYVGTASVAANSTAWSMQFGAAVAAVNQTITLLDPGSHTLTAVYSMTASTSVNASYTALGTAVALDSSISIVGSSALYRVYVNIVSGVNGDTLTADTSGTHINANYSNGTLQLQAAQNFTATVADFQKVMRSITFSSTQTDPSNEGTSNSRTIAWQLQIGTKNSNTNSAVKTTTVDITVPIFAPLLAIATGTITNYTNSGAIIANSGAVTISDNVGKLAAATVSLTTNFNSGVDTLAFNNSSGSLYGNIASSYNASTGVLSLNSDGATATLAQWSGALAAVTYANSATSRSSSTRTVSYQVNNGQGSSNLSNAVTASITISNTSAVSKPPVLAGGGNTTSVTARNQTVVVNSALVLTDADSTKFKSATVSDTGSTSDRDRLAFTNTNATSFGNISASYNSFVLTLSSSGSSATLAQWQAALRAVSYTYTSQSNNALSASSRTINFVLNDGAASNNLSNIAVTTLKLGTGGLTTFTTTTKTSAQNPTDSIDTGSSAVVKQSTVFSAQAPAYGLMIDNASATAPNILAVDGQVGLTETTDRAPTLSGVAAANVSIQIKLGSAVIGSVTSNADGSWAFSLDGFQSLSDGVYSFVARDTINGLTDSYALTVASPLPTTTVTDIHISADTGAADFATATAAQTISATIVGGLPTGGYVQGSVDGGATWTDVSAKVSGSTIAWTGATLLAGYMDANYDRYSIQFRVGNSAGFGPKASQDYLLVDHLATPVAITNVVYPTANQPTLSGTADPAGVVTLTYLVTGVPQTVTTHPDVGGNWSYTLANPLANGTYLFTATEADPVTGATGIGAGNTLSITIDTTLPTIGSVAISSDTGRSASDQITKTVSQTVTATLSKQLVTGQVLLATADGGQTWVDVTSKVNGTNVTWTAVTLTGGATGGAQVDGINKIEFQAKTTATSAKGSVTELPYVLDTTAPTIDTLTLDPQNHTVTLTFVETGPGFDTSLIPVNSAFTISDFYDGSLNAVALPVTSVSFMGTRSIVLGFSSQTNLSALDALTVDYAVPGSGSALTDLAGNRLLAFDPPVYNPISILANADTTNATEPGGVANATLGVSPRGNLLANDAGGGLSVDKIAAGLVVGNNGAPSLALAAVNVSNAGLTTMDGTYGTLQIAVDGSYSYAVDPLNAVIAALNVSSQPLIDLFTYEAVDMSGNVSASTVSISVHGANDAAVVSGTSTGAVTEASGVSNAILGTPTATGTLTNTDVDNTANTFTVVAAATASAGGVWHLYHRCGWALELFSEQ